MGKKAVNDLKKNLECVFDVMRCIVANIRINMKKTKIHLEEWIKTTLFFFKSGKYK